MATGTNIRTYFEGQWSDKDEPIMRAGDHGSWLGSTVFDGARYFEALQKRGLIVRPLGGYGMHDFLRITIGRQDENERLLAEMGLLLSGDAKRKVG